MVFICFNSLISAIHDQLQSVFFVCCFVGVAWVVVFWCVCVCVFPLFVHQRPLVPLGFPGPRRDRGEFGGGRLDLRPGAEPAPAGLPGGG